MRKIQSAGFALIWASTVLMLPLMSRAASYCYSTEGFPSALDNESKHRLGEYVARAVYEIEGATWDEGEAYNRVWVFFDDYRQGDWIVGATVNSIKALREEVEKERASAAA